MPGMRAYAQNDIKYLPLKIKIFLNFLDMGFCPWQNIHILARKRFFKSFFAKFHPGGFKLDRERRDEIERLGIIIRGLYRHIPRPIDT